MKARVLEHEVLALKELIGKIVDVELSPPLFKLPQAPGSGETKTYRIVPPHKFSSFCLLESELEFLEGAPEEEEILPQEAVQVINNLTAGVKHDGNKPRMELLSPFALTEISKVLTFGANKYADDNWRLGISWKRILGACLRHLTAIMRGEDYDEETNLLHAAHLGCEVMFLIEYYFTRKEFDDRYKFEGENK